DRLRLHGCSDISGPTQPLVFSGRQPSTVNCQRAARRGPRAPRALELDAHADPRAPRRSGAVEARIFEFREHLVRLTEQAERLVFLIERILDPSEQGRAIPEAVFGA